MKYIYFDIQCIAASRMVHLMATLCETVQHIQTAHDLKMEILLIIWGKTPSQAVKAFLSETPVHVAKLIPQTCVFLSAQVCTSICSWHRNSLFSF